jgi:hypothetical protein
MIYIYIKEDSFLSDRGVILGNSYEGVDTRGKCILIYCYNEEGMFYSVPCKRSCLIPDPENKTKEKIEIENDEFTLL